MYLYFPDRVPYVYTEENTATAYNSTMTAATPYSFASATMRRLTALIYFFKSAPCTDMVYQLSLFSSYRFMGVLLIFAFYRTRERSLPVQVVAAGCVMLFGFFILRRPSYARRPAPVISRLHDTFIPGRKSSAPQSTVTAGVPDIMVLLYAVAVNLIFHAFCPLVIFCGFPCPGCGVSRATFCFVTGRGGVAWQLNLNS